jgi:ribose-phosphate pyrophosphokinase
MSSAMMILGFDDYEGQSRKLAGSLGIPYRVIQRHLFPDGESRLTLPDSLPEHVIICRSLDQPNEKLVELLLATKTARKLGARKLTLIAPYLCYMRQDKAFHPGEAVSQPIIGNFIAGLFDNVITVDPHLHRIDHLEQAIPAKHAVSLSATSLMTEFLREHTEDPVLLGPDNESEQWVSAVAKPGHWDYGVCKKIRTGDKEVEISLPDINLSGRSVVIVDDVASSGQTLAVTAKLCLSKKAEHVDVLVTHALFAGDAKARLDRAGVRKIWSTDSVSHESNVIPLCALLGDAVLRLD